MKEKGILFIVATPIGNLSEMSPRAIETLKSVHTIFCEDTRETLKLNTYFNISKPLISCHQHNEINCVNKIIELLEKGEDVALVSDSGYPGISDPGNIVVSKVVDNNFDVVVVSGPSAFINALVGSGLPSHKFSFHGFLSSKRSERKKELDKLLKNNETLIFYESPHRIEETLKDMQEIFGERKIALCRELTKKFEEYIRGTISEVLRLVLEREIKGEIVLVVQGNPKEEVITISNLEIIASIEELIREGKSTKDAIREVAEKNDLKKNEIYRIYHQ